MPSKREGGTTTFNKNKYESPENQYVRNEKLPWDERVEKARNNKNALEFTRAVEMANKLLDLKITAYQLEEMGETNVQELCGSEYDGDMATLVGIAYQLGKIRRPNQKQ